MDAKQVIYGRSLPENLKSSYGEFDQVDFIISAGMGRALELQSVRLEGEVAVTADGTNFLNSTTDVNGTPANQLDIKLDPLVGAHAFCESWTVALGDSRIIENMGADYPRYVKMATSATEGVDDMMNASNACEMKAPFPELTNAILGGEEPGTQPSQPLRANPDFSIKPKICLNAGLGQLAHRRVGDIRVTVTLARTAAALYGNDMTTQVTYALQNLRLSYRTVPDNGNNDPVMMNTKIALKQSVQSSFANVQTQVPGVCTSVSCSFNEQALENTFKNNNTRLAKVPNLQQTQFLMNDATNQLISFILKDNTQVIGRYIDSFLDTSRNALQTYRTANQDGFGVGVSFGQPIDLSQQKFAVQLSSGITSTIPMIIYMYFHSFVQV